VRAEGSGDVKVVFAKSNWEVPGLSLADFLERAHACGFAASEIYLPGRPEAGNVIARMHADAGMSLIAQIATTGSTPQAHQVALRAQLARAAAARPLFVNCHTGRDIFDWADNLEIFRVGQEVADDLGVVLCHELHRGRALYNGPDTSRYLAAMPDLKLTADFSHWFCVHEGDLRDQPDNVGAAVAATHHIHARVGFEQSAQVCDPRLPRFAPWLDRHMELWRQILRSPMTAARQCLTITPEFGPWPYMPVDASTDEPVRDAWELNLWMRAYLVEAGFGQGG
jgi:hypothetical protein